MDSLEVSSKVCTAFMKDSVEGLKELLKTRFEPSLCHMTVVPKNPDNFSWDKADSTSYEVLSGRHLLLALKALDKEGILDKFPTLKN